MSARRPNGAAEEHPRDDESVKILLVDDRPENLAALRATLDSPNYELVTATSGAEALRALLRDEFALILLDVLMPDMDGFELAGLIKERAPTADVPIIFLTAVGTDLGFIYKGYSAGAVDYLVKPIDADVVRAKVAVFVDLYRKNRQIKRQAELLQRAEQRERAHQLKELSDASLHRYRNLAESIPHIVWTAQPDGTVDYYNHRFGDLTGHSLEQARDWLMAVHPDDAAARRPAWHEAIATGHPFEAEVRLRRARDGVYVWHLCRALPERNAQGAIVAWLGTFTDVDDSKSVASALHEFRATLDAVLDAVWIFDPATLQFTYVNEGASLQAGFARDELLTMTPLALMPRFDESSFRQMLDSLHEGWRAVASVETVARRRDGREHPVEISLQYIARGGERGRFVAIVRDVTERKHAEDERTRLYNEAQSAVRARDEFLSIASHELKTPVTALQLQVKNLERAIAREVTPPTVVERMTNKLQVVERSTSRLTKLIDNLLDISRITAGRIEIELEDLDFCTVVRDVVDRSRDDVARAGCTIEICLNGPVLGRWDPMRLDQVITNLLSNAIKYGGGKPIQVTVDSDESTVRFTIRDHGIGIAPEDRERIFQRFERAVTERHYGGFGLGLWIVRQILVALSGDIRVESAPGEGSVFVFELPRQPVLGKSSERAARPNATAPYGAVVVTPNAADRGRPDAR